MKKILIFIINVYQIVISPSYKSCCRYIPTCSSYAKDALRKHDAFSATCYILIRILKCSPLGSYGVDLVPNENIFKKFLNKGQK